MTQIALYTELELEDDDIAALLRDICTEHGYPHAHVTYFTSPIDLIDRAMSGDEEPLNLVITPSQLPGMSGINAICEARHITPSLKSILFAPSTELAPEAAANDIDGYLVEPVSGDTFARTTSRLIGEISRFLQSSTLVNSRNGLCRIPYNQMLYCETSGHDQIVHMTDKSTITVRSSSQAMFDQFASDKRFFKAGSSYIVNLHEVEEARTSKGIAVLSDGLELNIPARLRKNFELALLGLNLT